MKPAVVAVGYDRPDSLKRLLNSVGNAFYSSNDIKLIISIDKSLNEKDVLKVANEFKWDYGEKIIRTFKNRQGLRRHIIQCGDYTEQYEAVIILEDDLIVSPNYYLYTQKALGFYKDEDKVTGIALYSHEWNGFIRKNFSPIVDRYDTYLGQFSITWGQTWTKKWWKNFKEFYLINENNLDDTLDMPDQIRTWSDQSWGKYFVYYIIQRDLYYVIPRTSLSTNCSEIGQHNTHTNNYFQVKLLYDKKEEYLFAPVKYAQKYDIFCENMKLEELFSDNIRMHGITVDLFGYNRNMNEKRYLLSTSSRPFKVVTSYGLQMRPIEMNIIFKISGNDIYLYDTRIASKPPKHKAYNNMLYEVKGVSPEKLFLFSFIYLIKNVTNKFCRIIKKIKSQLIAQFSN